MTPERKAIKQFISNVHQARYSDASNDLSVIIAEKIKSRVQKAVEKNKNNTRAHK